MNRYNRLGERSLCEHDVHECARTTAASQPASSKTNNNNAGEFIHIDSGHVVFVGLNASSIIRPRTTHGDDDV